MNEVYSSQIEHLYLKMFNFLFEYARSALPNDSLAEEAVQETFRIACLKPDALCTSPRPEGWLVNTLKYVISNMERSRKTANRIIMEYLAVHAGDIVAENDMESIDVLYGDLAQMEEFKILKEMALDGLSHLEMAQARGISVEACRKRVQRAKETLRKKICR